jgi:hypothetical protein
MKPVAWNIKENREAYREDNPNDIVALYTAPRELSDEEIYACFHQYFVLGTPRPTWYELDEEDLIDFARAILKKASEK